VTGTKHQPPVAFKEAKDVNVYVGDGGNDNSAVTAIIAKCNRDDQSALEMVFRPKADIR
jgi:hypothetical protein